MRVSEYLCSSGNLRQLAVSNTAPVGLLLRGPGSDGHELRLREGTCCSAAWRSHQQLNLRLGLAPGCPWLPLAAPGPHAKKYSDNSSESPLLTFLTAVANIVALTANSFASGAKY